MPIAPDARPGGDAPCPFSGTSCDEPFAVHAFPHWAVMVRRDAAGARLVTRNSVDWDTRFPLIADATTALRVKACGEPACCYESVAS